MSGRVDAVPRWPRDRWISPTTLNAYRNCPYRVCLQHIDRIREPFVYNVFLRKGRIAHSALKRIADALARGREPIDDSDVLTMARLRLPPQEFPSEELRMAEAGHIVRWVRVGRRYIEAIPDPGWVLVEKNLSRPWPIFHGMPAYTLMARPDVVLQRHDRGHQPLFEIIDYKTGKRRPETMPPVIMRFAARDLLKQRVGDASGADVRFTYLWLETCERDEIDLSVEFCNDAWKEIVTDLERLVRDAEWRATPSGLCRYCPYHGNVCTEKIPYDNPYW